MALDALGRLGALCPLGRYGKDVRLTANPMWSGAQAAFPEVIVRDADPAQQVTDIGSGAADVALDLSPAQADRIAASAMGSTGSTGSTGPTGWARPARPPRRSR